MIYSNQGYAIVGAMLEKITGQDCETLITERLFKPLHMDTAGFGPPGTKDTVDQPWGHIHKLFMTIPMQADNPPAIASAGACIVRWMTSRASRCFICSEREPTDF